MTSAWRPSPWGWSRGSSSPPRPVARTSPRDLASSVTVAVRASPLEEGGPWLTRSVSMGCVARGLLLLGLDLWWFLARKPDAAPAVAPGMPGATPNPSGHTASNVAPAIPQQREEASLDDVPAPVLRLPSARARRPQGWPDEPASPAACGTSKAPVAAFQLELQFHRGPLERETGTTLTVVDSEGRFTVEGLAPGTYTLGVAAYGLALASSTVSVPPGSTAAGPMEITLFPGVRLEGHQGAAGSFRSRAKPQLQRCVAGRLGPWRLCPLSASFRA